MSQKSEISSNPHFNCGVLNHYLSAEHRSSCANLLALQTSACRTSALPRCIAHKSVSQSLRCAIALNCSVYLMFYLNSWYVVGPIFFLHMNVPELRFPFQFRNQFRDLHFDYKNTGQALVSRFLRFAEKMKKPHLQARMKLSRWGKIVPDSINRFHYKKQTKPERRRVGPGPVSPGSRTMWRRSSSAAR